jgi:transcription antitermination factor NusG
MRSPPTLVGSEYEQKPVSAFDGAVAWCVAYTKSRQEKALARDLQALGIACYLPLIKTVRFYGRRKLSCKIPLFAGYVFVSANRPDIITADRTKRVVRFIQPPDHERLRGELESIRLALEIGGELTPTPMLTHGVAVEITSGPFRGVRGVVANITDASRVVLNVDLIGRAAALEIERDLLRPL